MSYILFIYCCCWHLHFSSLPESKMSVGISMWYSRNQFVWVFVGRFNYHLFLLYLRECHDSSRKAASFVLALLLSLCRQSRKTLVISRIFAPWFARNLLRRARWFRIPLVFLLPFHPFCLFLFFSANRTASSGHRRAHSFCALFSPALSSKFSARRLAPGVAPRWQCARSRSLARFVAS